MQIQEILEVCIYADDLDDAETFYRDVIGLKLLSKVAGRHVFFRCGARVLLIFNPTETLKTPDLPAHGTTGDGHLCFATREDELDAWRAHLVEQGVEIEHEATWGERGRSLYFRDPAGNSLEIGTPRIWGIDEDEAL